MHRETKICCAFEIAVMAEVDSCLLYTSELLSPVASLNGAGEAIVQVPQGTDESFEAALNPMSGALVSCAELLTQNGTTTSEGSVSYGTVQVVQGEGSTQSSTSNS